VLFVTCAATLPGRRSDGMDLEICRVKVQCRAEHGPSGRNLEISMSRNASHVLDPNADLS
jgi:hypothetical protein